MGKYGGSTGTKTEATFNVKTVKSVGATVTADIAGKIKITKFDEADANVKLKDVVFEIRDKATNQLGLMRMGLPFQIISMMGSILSKKRKLRPAIR